MANITPRPLYFPGKTAVPTAPEPVWAILSSGKSFAPAGTQIPDGSARLDIPDKEGREDIFTSKKTLLFFNKISVAQAKWNYYRHDNRSMHIQTVQAT